MVSNAKTDLTTQYTKSIKVEAEKLSRNLDDESKDRKKNISKVSDRLIETHQVAVVTEIRAKSNERVNDFLKQKVELNQNSLAYTLAKQMELEENLTQVDTKINNGLIRIDEAIETALSRIDARNKELNASLEFAKKSLVPIGSIFNFIKECPKGYHLLDGSEIVDNDDMVLYLESGNYPDYRERYFRSSSNALTARTFQDDATAKNGLYMRYAGLHNQQRYQRVGFKEGSSLAGTSYHNEVSRSTYTAGNHIHQLVGDNETRPVTVVVNRCIKER